MMTKITNTTHPMQLPIMRPSLRVSMELSCGLRTWYSSPASRVLTSVQRLDWPSDSSSDDLLVRLEDECQLLMPITQIRYLVLGYSSTNFAERVLLSYNLLLDCNKKQRELVICDVYGLLEKKINFLPQELAWNTLLPGPNSNKRG